MALKLEQIGHEHEKKYYKHSNAKNVRIKRIRHICIFILLLKMITGKKWDKWNRSYQKASLDWRCEWSHANFNFFSQNCFDILNNTMEFLKKRVLTRECVIHFL